MGVGSSGAISESGDSILPVPPPQPRAPPGAFDPLPGDTPTRSSYIAKEVSEPKKVWETV